jgi:hypothetical protein
MQVYLIKVWFSSNTELVNLKVEANIEEYIFFIVFRVPLTFDM